MAERKRTRHKWDKDGEFGHVCVKCGLHEKESVLEDGINGVVRTTFPSGVTKTQLGGKLLRGCVGSRYGPLGAFTVKARKQTLRSRVRVFLYRVKIEIRPPTLSDYDDSADYESDK